MNRLFLALSIGICVALVPGSLGRAQSPAADQNPLNVRLIWQTQSNLCWAASAEMIMNFAKHDVLQCVQASRLCRAQGLGPVDCCQSPKIKSCNQTGYPSFCQFQFESKCTSGQALSWCAVMDQINHKKPFAFAWVFENGDGHAAGNAHMMVAFGYVIKNGVDWLFVNDPLPENQGSTWIMPYDYYVRMPGHHGHDNDYYDIAYNPETQCPSNQCGAPKQCE